MRSATFYDRAHRQPHHLPQKGKRGTKIVSWNVNGLRAILNKGTLLEYVAAEEPDILCLNETKIDASLTASVRVG